VEHNELTFPRRKQAEFVCKPNPKAEADGWTEGEYPSTIRWKCSVLRGAAEMGLVVVIKLQKSRVQEM